MLSNAQKQTTQRLPVSGRIAKEVRYQIAGLSDADIGAYTYERSKSQYKDAKADLSIFDPAGKLVLRGRDFGDRTFFWSADAMDVRLAT
jgi:hypothetical protein